MWNIGRIARRTARRLAALAAALCGSATAVLAAPASASQIPPPGTGGGGAVSVRTVMVGGTPGWQIVLLAMGAAVLAAVTAVLADRIWSARRRELAMPAR